ncbi:MAG TPA: peptidoglycan DD-metalloendopeptidase family protein [Candidatus Eubacterium faecavium]|nr:peptidoglycan DD-metalloendopeptidase family protein [Candidatus Eubacterium faecavium]
MKRFDIFKKSMCVLSASLFVFMSGVYQSPAADSPELTPEQEKAALEQRIKETENKLSELAEQSSNTQEYFNTLSDKISYLDRQYELVSDEVAEDKKQVEILKATYSENEKEIKSIGTELVALEDDCQAAEEEFASSYETYAQRMRAMYISGETNVLVFLLTSNDISQLLTRLEMVKRVSEMDGELLESIDNEISEIQTSRQQISEKRTELQNTQTKLKQTRESLEAAIPQLEKKQTDLSQKKAELDVERQDANELLKELNTQTGNYTEFLEDDKKAMEEIDAAIEDAADRYEDQTTAKPSDPTTEKPSSGGDSPDSGGGSDSRYISLTYPVPSQTRITCAFGEYSGHSGADFSCASGSKVVAAESGTVIISADLKNADGSYRSYGRYIVIMHDKTTSSGDKVYTLYAHNSERLVTQGQYVEKGQQIAESGSTGNSTGPHCHFEVRTPSSSYSSCKDPALYLP